MTTPVPAVDPTSMLNQLTALPQTADVQHAGATTSFAQILANGIDKVNEKAIGADNLVRAFTLDDSIPVHQVTYALSQAQMSLELMMQVRNRLADGYQQLMNMQL
ncbi:MAG TPA: flagellar hook-basal body complex protein FliE [Rhizomicrobium sp.]|jgi:flagellar hook-basal body complex protein FliE